MHAAQLHLLQSGLAQMHYRRSPYIQLSGYIYM
jgi:hypothetical protein